MRRKLALLPTLALLATLFLAPLAARAEEGSDEDVLVVRYAFLVGGREAGSATKTSGVMSPGELSDFLLAWDPESDNEEVRQVFALNDLGEVARQASELPLTGGSFSGVFHHGNSEFEIAMKVYPSKATQPGLEEEVIAVAGEIKRNGEIMMMPTVHSLLGERAMITATNGPEAPFIFFVVEVDRLSRGDLWRRGLRHALNKGYMLVDGEKVVAPVVVEKAQPGYPEDAKKAKHQGKVVLRLMIDDEGTVENAEVIEGQPYGLSEAALGAARKWSFKPALHDGEPVAVIYVITINFRLQ